MAEVQMMKLKKENRKEWERLQTNSANTKMHLVCVCGCRDSLRMQPLTPVSVTTGSVLRTGRSKRSSRIERVQLVPECDGEPMRLAGPLAPSLRLLRAHVGNPLPAGCLTVRS